MAIPELGCTCAGEIRPSKGPFIVPRSTALFVIPTDEKKGWSGSQLKIVEDRLAEINSLQAITYRTGKFIQLYTICYVIEFGYLKNTQESLLFMFKIQPLF